MKVLMEVTYFINFNLMTRLRLLGSERSTTVTPSIITVSHDRVGAARRFQ